MKTFLRIWTIPFILGIISTIGLLSALNGDKLWDALSWFALGIPLFIGGYYLIISLRNKKQNSET